MSLFADTHLHSIFNKSVDLINAGICTASAELDLIMLSQSHKGKALSSLVGYGVGIKTLGLVKCLSSLLLKTTWQEDVKV